MPRPPRRKTRPSELVQTVRSLLEHSAQDIVANLVACVGTVDSEPMDDSNENADEDDDQPNDEKETGEDDDVVESDDGVATSSKPTMRSLRPRRKAGAK